MSLYSSFKGIYIVLESEGSRFISHQLLGQAQRPNLFTGFPATFGSKIDRNTVIKLESVR